jgi:anti-sigma B factor antagonist
VDADEFSVDVALVDGTVIITVKGDLDMATVPALESALDELDHAHQVVIDATDLAFMDSSGLRLLTQSALSRFKSGGSVRIRNAPSHVLRVLQITDLADVLLEPAVDPRPPAVSN